MSKHEQADLILKLYDLRRESVMRDARSWFFRDFHPESPADYKSAMFGAHGGHLRMVMSYWDMAAALVHHGAISKDMFNDTNGEHFAIFAKLEPILNEIREEHGSSVLTNLEKLIDATPDGRERTADMRERMRAMRPQISATTATAQ